MTTSKTNIGNLQTQIKSLQILLIAMTIVEVGYLLIIFAAISLWLIKDAAFHTNLIILMLHAILTIIFIWFNWDKMPSKRKTKINSTLLFLLLGILGMWLWLPNKREVQQLLKKQTARHSTP